MKKFNKSKSVLLILMLSIFALIMTSCTNDKVVEPSSQSVTSQSGSLSKSCNLDLNTYYFKSFDDVAYQMANAKIGIPSEWEELSREPYKSQAEKEGDEEEDIYPDYTLKPIWAFTTEGFDFHMSILERYDTQQYNPNFPENYGTYDYSLGNFTEENTLEIGGMNAVEELYDRALRYTFSANGNDSWTTELRFYFHDGNPPNIDDLRQIAMEMLESYSYVETVEMPIIMNYLYGFYPEDSPIFAGINQKLNSQKEEEKLPEAFQSPGFVSLYKSGGITDQGTLYNFSAIDLMPDNPNPNLTEEVKMDFVADDVKYFNPYLGDASYEFSPNFSPLFVKKDGTYITDTYSRMYTGKFTLMEINTDFKKEYYPISKNLLLDDWGNLYYFNFEIDNHLYDNTTPPITDEDLTLISENVKDAASTQNGQIYILTITGDLLYLIQPQRFGGDYYPLLATNVESMRLLNGITTSIPNFINEDSRPVSLFFQKDNTLYCINEPDEKESLAALNSSNITTPKEYYVIHPLDLETAVTYDWSDWTERRKLKNPLMLIAKDVETYDIDTRNETLLLASFDSNGEYYINNKKQDISMLIPEGRKIMQTRFIYEEPLFLLDDGTICVRGNIFSVE